MELIYLADLTSIHTVRWVNYFASLNKGNVFCLSLGSNLSDINQDIIVYKLKGFKNIFNVLKSLTLISSKSKSIVHVHYLGWNALLLFFANKNKKIILTPWGCDIYANRKNFIKRFFLKYMFKKCDYIICDSKKLIEASCSFGANPIYSKVIAFGTDTEKFQSKRKIFLNTTKNEKIRVGTNRCMENIYDPFTLLKAAKYLKMKNKSYRFIIANDGSLEKKLKNYVIKNKLEQMVEFIGRQYEKDNINFYSNIDIYVSTSLRDGGLAASIAEAMSCERLVIVSNNSDNSDFISHASTGYLFENKDYKTLANLIDFTSQNIKNSRDIAKEARKVILEKCNYYKEMNKVYEIYKNIQN